MARANSVARFVLSFDAFREIPTDLTQATYLGSFFSIVAYFVCMSLFVCELSGFLSDTPETTISMDANQDKQLRINFDVVMHDLPCKNLVIGVWDSFGSERLNITSNVQRTKIDHEGNFVSYTEDEMLKLDKIDFTDEEMAEYNRDWSSSSEKHSSFDNVIESHDFTFINFYAGWCLHCRAFAPEWDQFEASINSAATRLTDKSGTPVNFRVIKINCVDFEETCTKEKIQGFPTVRLYRRSLGSKRSFSVFQSERSYPALMQFARDEVERLSSQGGDAHFHNFFKEGCRAEGFVEVARVPGTLHFEAAHSGDDSLNFAFTNVSHSINHLSFSTADGSRSLTNKYPSKIPETFRKHVGILDGRSFITTAFHQAPHHYIQAVSTFFEDHDTRSYQLTHQHRLSQAPKQAIPQAKFSFSLAPVEVRVSQGGKKWYEFVTSVFAIVGGAFTVTGILQSTSSAARRALKENLGKIL